MISKTGREGGYTGKSENNERVGGIGGLISFEIAFCFAVPVEIKQKFINFSCIAVELRCNLQISANPMCFQ